MKFKLLSIILALGFVISAGSGAMAHGDERDVVVFTKRGNQILVQHPFNRTEIDRMAHAMRKPEAQTKMSEVAKPSGGFVVPEDFY